MRKQFELFEDDRDFLESLGLPWETIVEGKMLWILIHEFNLSTEYKEGKVSLAINMPTGYPRTQLDMVYFYPAISRNDNQPIGALAPQNIDGKTWQRWSRHRTRLNAWREGVDNLATHFALIEYWLEREFKLRPHAVSA